MGVSTLVSLGIGVGGVRMCVLCTYYDGCPKGAKVWRKLG